MFVKPSSICMLCVSMANEPIIWRNHSLLQHQLLCQVAFHSLQKEQKLVRTGKLIQHEAQPILCQWPLKKSRRLVFLVPIVFEHSLGLDSPSELQVLIPNLVECELVCSLLTQNAKKPTAMPSIHPEPLSENQFTFSPHHTSNTPPIACFSGNAAPWLHLAVASPSSFMLCWWWHYNTTQRSPTVTPSLHRVCLKRSCTTLLESGRGPFWQSHHFVLALRDNQKPQVGKWLWDGIALFINPSTCWQNERYAQLSRSGSGHNLSAHLPIYWLEHRKDA